jgi:hypothetical protein
LGVVGETEGGSFGARCAMYMPTLRQGWWHQRTACVRCATSVKNAGSTVCMGMCRQAGVCSVHVWSCRSEAACKLSGCGPQAAPLSA